MGELALRRYTPTMPTNFTPGWNASTLLWILGGFIAVSGMIVAAFVSARYSLLGKVLEVTEAQGKRSDDRANVSNGRFDLLETKLHGIESDLAASRNETLLARQELLSLKQENVELRESKKRVEAELAAMRIENRRLSGECDKLRRQVAFLQNGTGEIDIIS